MRPLALRFVLAAVIGIAGLTANAGLRAEPAQEDDAQQVRSVIVTQLLAFAENDADGAFETTTPEVRDAVGNSVLFLTMVRHAYPMIYQPTSVTFMRAELLGDAVVQLVEIIDGQAKSWLALFLLERQPDASWLISGYTVAENRWVSI